MPQTIESPMNAARLLTRTTCAGLGFRSIPVGAFMSRTGDGGLGLLFRSTDDVHFLCFLTRAQNQLGSIEDPIGNIHVAFHTVVQHLGLAIGPDDHKNRRFTTLRAGVHTKISLLAVIEDL